MSIEVNIPVEIDEYKEKIIFGLTLRKLIWGSVTIICAVLSSWVYVWILHIPITIAGYLIFLTVIPPLAIGFIPIKGMPVEQYLRLYFRWLFSGKRKYITHEGSTNNELYSKSSKPRPRSQSELTYSFVRRPVWKRRILAIRRIWRAKKEMVKAKKSAEKCAAQHSLQPDA